MGNQRSKRQGDAIPKGQLPLSLWGKEPGREGERIKLGEWEVKMELINEGSLKEVSFKGEDMEHSL